MECFWSLLFKYFVIFLSVTVYVGLTSGIGGLLYERNGKVWYFIGGCIIMVLGIFIFAALKGCGFINIDL